MLSSRFSLIFAITTSLPYSLLERETEENLAAKTMVEATIPILILSSEKEG